MTRQVDLLTNHETFTKLHAIANGRKSTVKIDREELLHLLMDHSTMVGALGSSSTFQLREPQTRRERPRLRSGP